jgi:FkbM family methyltransferase
MINVLYDADPDCLEQVKEVNQGLQSELKIYPCCISNKKENVNFFKTYDPNLSSFYKPKKFSLDYYYFSHAGYDYSFNECSKIEEVINLETTTLDILMDKHKPEFFMPDFISMDTQGSELEILDGSPVCTDNALAVVLETEFLEFYEDQPCFEDVLKSMKNKGFDFIRFTSIAAKNCYRYPIELRSSGRLTEADALFIRSPEFLENTNRFNAISFYKLAFIYLSFDMLEPALECIRKIDENWELSNNREYFKFLNKLYISSKQYSSYPKTFSDIYSSEQSKSRYSSNVQKPSHVRLFFKNLGPLTKIIKIFRNILIVLRKTLLNLIISIIFMNRFKKNEIEVLLEENGFISLSKLVHDNRMNFYKSDY